MPTVGSGRTIYRARQRLDPVAMGIERRELQELSDNPDRLISAHLFSDGSPVVGIELQGMVLQLMLTTGAVMTKILPGAALQYGMCRAIDKAVALLWALFLICGSLKVHGVNILRNTVAWWRHRNVQARAHCG